MQLTPECDPRRSYLSSDSTLCVTPERAIQSTRMGPRDLGFSLTDNWRVIWDPPLVAHLYYLGFRCSISPHCLVARRYILMTDVWPILVPWHTCFVRYWPTPLVGPAYVAPTLQVVSQRPGTGRYTSPQSRAITCSAKRLSPCPGWSTWLYSTRRKYCVKVTSFRACLICAHVSLING